MSSRYRCPACGVSLTLAGPPESDFECPQCDRAVVPVPVTPKPTPQADEPPARAGLWADRRVRIGAIACGAVLALVTIIAIASGGRKPADPGPEVVHIEPPGGTAGDPPTTPPPITPPIKPPEVVASGTSVGEVIPPPRPVERAPREEAPQPRVVVAPPQLDRFGNPVGDVGLARDGEFKGHRILFWCGWADADRYPYFGPDNPLWKGLEAKGFVVRREFGEFRPAWLDEADQVWVLSFGDVGKEVSGAKGHPLDAKALTAIIEFAKAGKGLYLLADNEPLTFEAHNLAKRLFGVAVAGNFRGDQVAAVRGGIGFVESRRLGAQYSVDPHPLLTGVNLVYEGLTVGNVGVSDELEVAFRASDGKPLLAVSRVPGLRVAIDAGFTRYYGLSIPKSPGTVRLAQNVAAHLAGKK